MASCKECYHYEVCRMHYRQKCELTYETEKEVRRAMLQAEKGSPICDYFKARSRFVELPYPLKVGDVVFFILENLDNDVFDNGDYLFRIGNCAVASGDMVTEVGTSGFWYRGLYHDGRTTTFVPDSDDFVRWEDVGKDVFLTREEAEQALKERDTK